MDEHCFDARPVVRKTRLNVLPPNPEIASETRAVGLGRFPSWLHRKLPKGSGLAETGRVIEGQRLNTVCEEASCPNLLECWSKKTATFLAMGRECSRSCGFCSISFSKAPPPLDEEEPDRIAESVKQLGLRHVVITMVARDDLPDGGALHLSRIVAAIRAQNPESTVELLTSDFLGNQTAWDSVLEAKPEVFNYNIETVKALTPKVRHTATYDRTLQFLHYASTHKKNNNMRIKSGLMAGLGETDEEIQETIRDLYQAGCNIVTIGQYLQPDRHKLLVKRFVSPEQFEAYAAYGRSIGVPYMHCGPFVRSSYNAGSISQYNE